VRVVEKVESSADKDRASKHFRGADPEDRRPHRRQAFEAKFQADRKKKQDDAQLGERVDCFGI
jgi:hypothetical protein